MLWLGLIHVIYLNLNVSGWFPWALFIDLPQAVDAAAN